MKSLLFAAFLAASTLLLNTAQAMADSLDAAGKSDRARTVTAASSDRSTRGIVFVVVDGKLQKTEADLSKPVELDEAVEVDSQEPDILFIGPR